MNENEIKFIQTEKGITQANEFNTKITYWERKQWRIGSLAFTLDRICVFATIKAHIKYFVYNAFRSALNAFGIKVDFFY